MLKRKLVGKSRYDAPLLLSAAARNGTLAKARCSGCSKPRWYDCSDLMRVYGDIPAENLELLMPCETCGDRGMRVYVRSVPAADRQRITVRRLERVMWLRQVVWVDEKK